MRFLIQTTVIGLLLASSSLADQDTTPASTDSSEKKPIASKQDKPTKDTSQEVSSLAFGLPHLSSEQIGAFFERQAQGKPLKSSDSKTNEGGEDSVESQTLAENLTRLVDQLSSSEFATRERATAGLRELGDRALPALRATTENHADLEVRMRAQDVANGIASGLVAGRIDSFLAGKDVSLDGWLVFQAILGDGVKIRELFVEMTLRHPEVLSALSGTSTQRTKAMKQAVIHVQRGLYIERRTPSAADTFSMLLCANDPNAEISPSDEDLIFAALRLPIAGQLFKDLQLQGPFRALVGGWLVNMSDENHGSGIWFAMTWQLTEVLPVAIETVKNSTDPASLRVAMQAIARFGSKEHVPYLKPLLTDERPASDLGFANGEPSITQVRDIAMAAIVLLNDKKLSEIGMSDDALHPNFGFIVDDISFPRDNPKPRESVLKKFQELIKD